MSFILTGCKVSIPTRLVQSCLFSISSTKRQWTSPSSGSRNAKSPRWGASQSRKHDPWRNKERRPPLSSTSNNKNIPEIIGEGVYGLHSVLQALECGHRKTHALYVREKATLGQRMQKKKEDSQALERIKDLATAIDLPVHSTTKWMLNHMTGDKPHQGVVLDAAPIQLNEFVPGAPSVDFTKSEKSPVILVLDEIHDPQNFGAILRSAHFLGGSALVVSDQNSAPLSPAVSRASVGALEVLVANNKLFKARDLHEMLAISRDFGWHIVGASTGSNSITSTKLSGRCQPTILVMGNEHRGLRKGIRECCEEIVVIPGQTTDTHVDSLNVSVASAILLYELLHH